MICKYSLIYFVLQCICICKANKHALRKCTLYKPLIISLFSTDSLVLVSTSLDRFIHYLSAFNTELAAVAKDHVLKGHLYCHHHAPPHLTSSCCCFLDCMLRIRSISFNLLKFLWLPCSHAAMVYSLIGPSSLCALSQN